MLFIQMLSKGHDHKFNNENSVHVLSACAVDMYVAIVELQTPTKLSR